MKMERKDRLEKYIENNKDGFNDLEVPALAWQEIEKSLNKPSKRRTFPIASFAWKAAAAILIFASAWYLNDFVDKPAKVQTGKTVAMPSVSSPVLNELSDAEAYYTSQINSRQAELANYAKEHPEIIEDLRKEFKELDRNNIELKRDLAESNADVKVIEAIIQSYRIKLEILEQMLTEMKDGNKEQAPVSKTL
jgi:hypothetical protein